MAFNEELVARAVFNSKIPVISAVGHETDYTICDFVADLRAPTPSAAAEIAVPDITELTADLLKIKQQMIISVKNKFNEERTRLLAIEKSGALKDPLSKLNENKRNLLYFSEKINDLTQAYIDRQKLHFSSLAGKLDTLSPLGVIARGYAIVSKGEDVLTKAKDFNIGDTVNIKLSDGIVSASVTGICEE